MGVLGWPWVWRADMSSSGNQMTRISSASSVKPGGEPMSLGTLRWMNGLPKIDTGTNEQIRDRVERDRRKSRKRETDRNRQRERQRKRQIQTDRDRDRQTETDRDRQRQTETDRGDRQGKSGLTSHEFGFEGLGYTLFAVTFSLALDGVLVNI